MEFRISKNDLVSLISKVSPGLDDGKVIPIYADILINVYTDALSLSTCSAEMQMSTAFPLVSSGTAAFGVNGKLFGDIIKNLNDGEIKFTIGDTNTLKISMGRKYLNIKIKPAEDFPLAPRYENMVFTPMVGFMEKVNSVSYAVSTDDTRPHLTCIFINEEDVVAVDGFRLALKKHDFPIQGSFLLPSKILGKIGKVFKEEVEVYLDSESNYLHVRKDLTVCSIRTVAREFVRYGGVLPSGPHDVATINKSELLQAFKLMSVVTDNLKDALMEFKENSLKISKKDQTIGELEDELVIDFAGEVTLGINWEFMTTTLNNIKEDTVTMEIYGPMKPMLIREGGDIHVIMPKKHNN